MERSKTVQVISISVDNPVPEQLPPPAQRSGEGVDSTFGHHEPPESGSRRPQRANAGARLGIFIAALGRPARGGKLSNNETDVQPQPPSTTTLQQRQPPVLPSGHGSKRARLENRDNQVPSREDEDHGTSVSDHTRRSKQKRRDHDQQLRSKGGGGNGNRRGGAGNASVTAAQKVRAAGLRRQQDRIRRRVALLLADEDAAYLNALRETQASGDAALATHITALDEGVATIARLLAAQIEAESTTVLAEFGGDAGVGTRPGTGGAASLSDLQGALKIPLMPFQQESVSWMYEFLFLRRTNGVNADEMGLGKTAQTIALLSLLWLRHGIRGPHLIVVPLSTAVGWQREFEAFAPAAAEFRVLFVSGLRTEQQSQLDTFFAPARRGGATARRRGEKGNAAAAASEADPTSTPSGPRNPYGADIVIVPQHAVVRAKGQPLMKRLLNDVAWVYCVVDEAHRIKRKESQLFTMLRTVQAKRRLALTGTPLQNNLDELWNLLSFLIPAVFDSTDVRRILKLFEALGARQPKTRGAGVGAAVVAATADRTELQIVLAHRLHRLVASVMIRREKVDVIAQLPTKHDFRIVCPMTEPQRRALLDPTVFHTAIQARYIAMHPYSLLPEFRIDEDICRSSGKLFVLDVMLRHLLATGHKSLVFCSWTTVLDVVETHLQFRGWGYVRLDGNTPGAARDDIMRRFATDPALGVFLLSKGSGGVGLNLQVADTVVMLDTDYNPQNDVQALSRVYRVGQTKPVRVFRLMTNTAVEGSIGAIAAAKEETEQLAIHAGRYDRRSSIQQRDRIMRNLLGTRDAALPTASNPPAVETAEAGAATTATPDQAAVSVASALCGAGDDGWRPRGRRLLGRCPLVSPEALKDALMAALPRGAEEAAALRALLATVSVPREVNEYVEEAEESEEDQYQDVVEDDVDGVGAPEGASRSGSVSSSCSGPTSDSPASFVSRSESTSTESSSDEGDGGEDTD